MASQRLEEPDPRNSLRHVLATEPSVVPQRADYETPARPEPGVQRENAAEHAPEEKRARSNSPQSLAEVPMYTSTTQTTRRNANGSVSSVYSGNKIRHLKKEDGVPLWRKDIQYEFLRTVFEDETAVFTKYSDGTKGHTFADIYIDAMAKSSKCSKILKEKLLTEPKAAINMAMVCLLVNVGRMNTTLNFFPEMRAQLRTYHSIPVLQAHQDANAYKQLQDAPRLKSILKGATEDTEQPDTIEKIMAAPVPRTNPVNLIFVLSQYAPKISELHFFPPRDFFDLVMKSALSSKSRANAFLWLVWWYLESDFSKKAALDNPFGPGQESNGSDPHGEAGDVPLKVPAFEYLNEEQAAAENIDTAEEQFFGEQKRKERIAILASDMAPVVSGPKPKSSTKKAHTFHAAFVPSETDGTTSPVRSPVVQGMASNGVHAKGLPRQISNYTEQAYHSESEVTRSPSPPLLQPFQVVNVPPKPTSGMNINTLLNETTPPAANPILTPSINRPGPGRGNWRRKNKSHGPPPVRRTPATTTPAPFIMEPQTAMTAQQSTGPHSQDPQFTAGVQFTSFLPPNQPLIANPFTYNNPLPPRVRKSKYDHSPPHSSHLDLSDPDTHPAITPRRTRPLTQHQVAISRYRKERVDYILDRQMRRVHDAAKRRREREGAVVRAWKRLKTLPPLYNSDAEETLALAAHTKKEEHHNNSNNNDPNPNIGTPKPRLPFSDTKVYMAGFAPARTEPDDLAEETAHYARALRKASRRLARWEGDGVTGIRKPEREKRRRERYEREREREREAEAEAERLRFGMERDGGEVGEDGEGEEGGDVAVRLRGGEGGEGYRGKSRGRRRVDRRMEMGSPAPADPDEEDDDGDGGGENGEGEGELDEMDRELLGEVDADESDSEGDGDGDAEGDVDGDVDGDVRMGDAS